jgi:hypothetical protein
MLSLPYMQNGANGKSVYAYMSAYEWALQQVLRCSVLGSLRQCCVGLTSPVLMPFAQSLSMLVQSHCQLFVAID